MVTPRQCSGALCRAFTGQPGHAAPGLHRLDFGSTEFGGLLHHPVHLFAAAQRLRQHDVQGRLTIYCAVLQITQHYPLPDNFADTAVQFIAYAIK